jgi:thiol-disulfide isomerase/thioredoxin
MMRGITYVTLALALASVTLTLAHNRHALESAAAAANDDSVSSATSAPEFPVNATWAQGDPLSLAKLKGRVTVVQFWTHGCVNCIHNYPVYRSWQEKYDGKALTIIGVHTPEFEQERSVDRVRAAAKKNGLKFPIVLDNDKAIWNAWNNHYWPAIYLVDKAGKVRYRWDGELHRDTAEGKAFARHIDELLAERLPVEEGRGGAK